MLPICAEQAFGEAHCSFMEGFNNMLSIFGVLEIILVILAPVKSITVLQSNRPLQNGSHFSVESLNLENFSICFDLKVFQFESYILNEGGATILSLNDGDIYFGITNTQVNIWSDSIKSLVGDKWRRGQVYTFISHNDYFHFLEYKLGLGKWTSLCLIKTQNNVIINDGHEIIKGFDINEMILRDIILLNHHSIPTPTLGAVTNLNIWNHTLNDEEISMFSSCKLSGNIFNWDQLKFTISEVETLEIDDDAICEKGLNDRKFKLIFQGLVRNPSDYKSFCRKLGFKIAVFNGEDDLKENSIKLDEEACSPHIFMGYRLVGDKLRNENNGSFVSLNTFSFKSMVKHEGYCVMYYTKFQGLILDDCNLEFCPICEHNPSQSNTVFMLRGVCLEHEVDVYYILVNSTYLLGYVSTEMVYVESLFSWVVRSNRDGKVLALYENKDFPIGLRNWSFTNRTCHDEQSERRALRLHLDVDQPGNFICDDGSFISSEHVCDDIKQCPKGEDERQCTMMKHPDIATDIPSYEVEKDEDDWDVIPTPIHASVKIKKILNIDELESMFELYFEIHLVWKDIYLHYEYLKMDPDQNFFQNMPIWKPHLEYYHIKEYHDFKPRYYAVRNISVQPKLSVDTDNINVREAHSGRDFNLHAKIKKSAQFLCSFDNIKWYPFGEQRCAFGFYIDFPSSEFAELTPLNFSSRSHPVGQYIVKEWSFKKANSSEEEGLVVEMILERDLGSIFMVSFFPSIIINIINQASVYISGDSKFDLIYMINITSMMVLASIYLSVSTSLPSTSEIKPVETWLLFNLSYPFLVIICHILLQVKFKLSIAMKIISFQRILNEKSSKMKSFTNVGKISLSMNIVQGIAMVLNPLLFIIFSLFFSAYYLKF